MCARCTSPCIFRGGELAEIVHMFDTGFGGVQQPVLVMERARSDPVGPTVGRRPVETDAPRGVPRGTRVATARPGPASASPTRRRRSDAPAGLGALRRAALPLQLQLPRRRQPPRGAGRGGGPARARGAGPHRPRRLLRRGPLRRGGPGARAAHRVRRRARPSGAPDGARPNGHRPADRHGRVPPAVVACSLADGPAGYARLARAHQRRRSWRGEKGAPRSFADLAERAPTPVAAGHWLVLTGCRKGTVPAALRGRRPGAPPARELDRLVDAFGRDRVRSSCGTTATRSTPPATTRSPSSPRRGRVDVRRHQQRALRHPRAAPARHRARRGAGPAQPRRDRRLAARRRPAPTCAPAPSRPGASPRYPGAVERAAELGPGVRLRPAARRARTCRRSRAPTATTEMELAARADRAGRRAPLRRPAAHGARSPRGRGPQIDHELDVIEQLGFPGYFLIVRDIVEFCRRAGHLLPGPGLGGQLGGLLRPRHHQGRRRRRSACCSSGSCRPSATARPTSTSTSRSDRREEVIQYVYERYGRDHAAQVANVITYRAQVGGARHGQGARLRPRPAGRLDQAGRPLGRAVERRRRRQPRRARHPGRRCSTWPAQVEDCPRHLGIHSGGMVICDRPVVEVCPVEWARMADRSVLQWDKDDCAAVGPGEVRPARARACSRRCTTRSTSCAEHHGVEVDLADHPPGGRGLRHAVRAPTRSACSRWRAAAQMATLPRLQAPHVLRPRGRGRAHPPRPDPGRVGAPVHPAAQRPGAGHLPAPAARARRWRKTLGVPLFQEQLMQMAIDVAGFTAGRGRPAAPGDGVQARRRSGWSGCASGSTTGMAERGITGEVADEHLREAGGLRQLRLPREPLGVASPTWCTTSSWLKLHHPAAFCAALLNAQPMGFYSPQSLVPTPAATASRCARPDLNASLPTATLEPCERVAGRGGGAARASARCAASAPTWPTEIAAGRPYGPCRSRTSPAGCRR